MFSPQCYTSETGHKQQKYVAVIYTHQPQHYNHLPSVLQVSFTPPITALTCPGLRGSHLFQQVPQMLDLIGIRGISSSVGRLGALGHTAPEEYRCHDGMCSVCSGVFLGCLSKKHPQECQDQRFFLFLPAEHCMVTRGWMLFPSAVGGFNVVAGRCDVTAWSKSLIKYGTVIQFSYHTDITFTVTWLK